MWTGFVWPLIGWCGKHLSMWWTHCCILLHAGSGRRFIVDVTLDRSEVRTQLRLGGGWFLVLVTTQLDNFSGGLLSTSEQVTRRRERLWRTAMYPWLLRDDCSGPRLVMKLFVVSLSAFLKPAKMMESFGVHYRSESSVTGHCAGRDHASAQYPVTRRTLPRTQSETYESVITHTCHPLTYSKQ